MTYPMRMRNLFITGLLIFLWGLYPLYALANDPPKSGGKPIFMIDGAWNPAEGAWSYYKIADYEKKQTSYMHFATMEPVTIQGNPGRWMEIFVKSEDEQGNPVKVVVRVLAREGAKGPENVVKVIVQPEGYPPFIVPESMLNGKDSVQNDMKQVSVDQTSIKEQRYKVKGKSIKAYKVEGKDEDGNRITAVVSGQVSPLGLVSADTGQLKMQLIDFGSDARTRITGTPMNFYLWIARIVGEGVSEAVK